MNVLLWILLLVVFSVLIPGGIGFWLGYATAKYRREIEEASRG